MNEKMLKEPRVLRGIEFLAFPAWKLIGLVACLGSVCLLVYATFWYAHREFGSLSLPTALERITVKEFKYVYYLMVYTQDAPHAAWRQLTASTFGYSRKPSDLARGVPVLMYHAIVDTADGHNLTEETFAARMFALKEAGWSTVTLEEFLQYMRGETTLPAHSFLLAFDDGAKDSYYPVDPILRALDYTAVSFILTKYSVGDGSFYYLSAGEIRDMLASGRWEIGSHGHDSHAFLPIDGEGTLGAALANRLWLPDESRVETPAEYVARVRQELAGSRQLLEQTFGRRVTTFAFPFGEFGQLSLNYPEAGQIVPNVASEMYGHAFYQTRFGDAATFNYPQAGGLPFLIRRIEPLPDITADELLAMLEKGFPKSLPYIDTFDENLGWHSVWGSYYIENGELKLEAEPNSTGNAVVLDGTNHFTDQVFSITLGPGSGTGVVLWSRFMSGRDNVACNFGKDFVHIEEIVGGEKRVVNGVRAPNLFPGDGATLSTRTRGRSVECAIDGRTVVASDFISRSLTQGSVGIKIWDEKPGVAKLNVEEVRIYEN